MIDVLVVVVALAAATVMVWGLLSARLGRPPGRVLLVLAAGTEVVLLVQAALAVVGMVRGPGPEGSTVLFVSYLATVVLVLPLGLGWALSERDRWSSAVLAVAGLTVAAMVVRLWAVWSGGAQIGGPGA